MDDQNQSGTNPSDQKKSWRSNVPEIPESENPPPAEPQPGTRQNVAKDQQQTENSPKKEDLPEATNQSKGKMGSGQRQDSN